MNTENPFVLIASALIMGGLLLAPTSGLAQVAAEGARAGEDQVRRVTLAEALELMESSYELRLARSRAAEAEAMARQSSAYPNPAVVASHESLDESGLGVSETYLTLSQPLEWPGARNARQAAATESALAARIRVSADSAELAFRVKHAFVEAAHAEREVEILTRVTAIFRRAVISAGQRYEQGDLSLYDLRRIEVERVRYEASLADAILALNAARRELAFLVAPDTDDFELAPADPPVGIPPPVDLDRLAAAAITRRPETAARQADVRSAQAELRGARAERVPDLIATGGFKRQSDGFNGLFIGMSVPLPLWNRSSGAIQAAGARLTGQEARAAFAGREVERDARRAVDAYRSQLLRAELVSQGDPQPTLDLLDVAQVSYDAGEMELIQLLDAAEALRDAQTHVARIRSDVWISYYDLERAVGGFDDLAAIGRDE